jgi:predicted Holliday junction resolvase-like endonuclease
MNAFMQTIDGMQEILAICPCCGDIFRLVEGKFIFPKARPRTCEYLDLVVLEKMFNEEYDRLNLAEERFDNKLENKRQELKELGRKKAKRKLKKIDPNFSGRNINPQDVKVIFNPIEYIIFHGLNSINGVDFIELISREPDSKAQEYIVKSIGKTLKNGDVEFETLHMREDGSFEIKKMSANS